MNVSIWLLIIFVLAAFYIFYLKLIEEDRVIRKDKLDYLSLETGNQKRLIYTPDIDLNKMKETVKIMDQSRFGPEMKFYHFVYLLIDPLFDQVPDHVSLYEFFKKLNRPQKIIFALNIFDTEVHASKNVCGFLLENISLVLAVSESFDVMELTRIASDLLKIISELDEHLDEFKIDQDLWQNSAKTSEMKQYALDSCSEYLQTSLKISQYYFTPEFKNQFYAAANTFIKQNLDYFAV